MWICWRDAEYWRDLEFEKLQDVTNLLKVENEMVVNKIRHVHFF